MTVNDGGPLTLSAFAAFCESKPAEEEYEYSDSRVCACAQYADAIGEKVSWRRALFRASGFWNQADHIACHAIPRTFGALAARLRHAAGERP